MQPGVVPGSFPSRWADADAGWNRAAPSSPSYSGSAESSDDVAEVRDSVADLVQVPTPGSHGQASQDRRASGVDEGLAGGLGAALGGEAADEDGEEDEIDWMAEGFWYSDMATTSEAALAGGGMPGSATAASSGAGEFIPTASSAPAGGVWTSGGQASGPDGVGAGSGDRSKPLQGTTRSASTPRNASGLARASPSMADVVIQAARKRVGLSRSGSVVVPHRAGLVRPQRKPKKPAPSALARRALARWRRRMEKLPPSLRRGKPSQWGRRHSIHEISRDVALRLLTGGSSAGSSPQEGRLASGAAVEVAGVVESMAGVELGAPAAGGGSGAGAGRLGVEPGSAADVRLA